MEYIVEGRKFNLSYQVLREQHIKFCEMADEEFLKNLPAILHLACVICYLKELPTYLVLVDTGIIHELIHLMHIPDSPVNPLQQIRELFKTQLQLT